MARSLTNLTDDLAKGLHKGKSEDCKSNLEYLTVKDGKRWYITFQCVDCSILMKKSLMKVYPRYSKPYISSMMETLRNSVSRYGKMFINKSTLMTEKDSMKRHYPQRRYSIATWAWRASQTLPSVTLKQSGKTLDYKI